MPTLLDTSCTDDSISTSLIRKLFTVFEMYVS